jgi:hypothetical protein
MKLKIALALIAAIALTAPASAERLTTAETLHYEPWFVKQGVVEQAANATLSGIYQPYDHTESWKFSIPVDWNKRGATNNWSSVLQSLYIIDPLALQFEATGDQRYLDRAMAIVRDWHRFHIKEGQNTEFSWSDAPAGIRSMKLAWLYSQGGISEEDRLLLRNLAETHITRVLDGSVEFRMTNHGIFQIHGIVTLCAAFELQPLCAEADSFVHAKLTALLDQQFDHEGMHVEHSPNYHRLAIDQFEFFVSTGLYKGFAELPGVIRKAKENLFWLSDPSNEYWQTGDTSQGSVPLEWREHYPAIECDTACLRAFDYGYVSIRGEASGLFVQGAFHSVIHKQHDDLSFELFEFGQKILTDSGAVGYETSQRRRYVQSSHAHNTVEIGQKDFNRRNEPYGSAIRLAERRDGHFYIQAAAPHPHLGAVHNRELHYWPGEKLILRDHVDFEGQPQKVAQWFHFHPDVEFGSREGSRIELTLHGRSIMLINQNGCPSTVRKGRTKPRWDGWYSPSPGVIVPRYAIAFICDGTEAIETTIWLDPSKAQASTDSQQVR